MRSFRAENFSAFVKALLDRDVPSARRSYEQLAERYPLVVTRELDAAKEWVRDHARGSERYGIHRRRRCVSSRTRSTFASMSIPCTGS
jgi:hypothetical protein